MSNEQTIEQQLETAKARVAEVEDVLGFIVRHALPEVPNSGMFAISAEMFAKAASIYSPKLKMLQQIAAKVEAGGASQQDIDDALKALGEIQGGGA